MATDPNIIALARRQQPAFNPINSVSQLMQLKGMQQQNEIGQMQLEDVRQARLDRPRLQAEADEKAKLERAQAGLKMFGGMAAGIKGLPPEQRGQAWQAAIQMLGISGYGELAQKLTEAQPDDATLTALIGTVRTAEQQMAENFARQQYDDAAPKRAADLAGTQAGTAKTEADVVAANVKLIQDNLGSATNQNQWTAALSFLRRRLPEELVAELPTEFSQENADYYAGLEAVLERRKQNEVERANLVDEAQGAQALALTRRGQDMAQARATAGGTDDQSLANLAEMVIGNPDILKDMTPTQRGQVLQTIANSGQGSRLANQKTAALRDILDSAWNSIQTLKTHEGRSGAVGAKGFYSLFGALDQPMSGTPARAYAEFVDTLKAQLSLPKLQFLRGLGSMSDREFSAIQSAVTALDRSMPEGDFMKELLVIEKNLQNTRNAMATPETYQREMMRGESSGEIRVISPDGKAGTIPAADWIQAQREGFRRQ